MAEKNLQEISITEMWLRMKKSILLKIGILLKKTLIFFKMYRGISNLNVVYLVYIYGKCRIAYWSKNFNPIIFPIALSVQKGIFPLE